MRTFPCLASAALALALAAATLGGVPPASAQGQPFPYADAAQCQGRTYFDVVNRSRTPVLELYIRPSGQTGNWGKDRLGDAVIAPGGRMRVDPGLGVFDVLLLRSDGRAFLTMRQRSCTINAVELGANNELTVR